MSDYGNEGGEEFEMEWPSGGEDENEMQGPEIEMQNTFYTAEDKKRNSPQEALDMFETVIMLSESIGDDEVTYRFNSLKNIVVLSAQLHKLDNMLAKQRYMLKMVSKVAREDLAEAVNSVLDSVATNLGAFPDYQSQMYSLTLEVLRANNERLWFTICLRLAKIQMDMKQFEKLDLLINELKESCRLQNGQFDQSKANLLLDVLAIEIQMCSLTKNNPRMKAVYHES
jgi:COP9 signalosome complex subunit 2